MRFHSRFADIDVELHDTAIRPLCRLRSAGSAGSWGLAIHFASRDAYQDLALPSGMHAGNPEQALDCARMPCPNDPSAR